MVEGLRSGRTPYLDVEVPISNIIMWIWHSRSGSSPFSLVYYSDLPLRCQRPTVRYIVRSWLPTPWWSTCTNRDPTTTSLEGLSHGTMPIPCWQLLPTQCNINHIYCTSDNWSSSLSLRAKPLAGASQTPSRPGSRRSWTPPRWLTEYSSYDGYKL